MPIAEAERRIPDKCITKDKRRYPYNLRFGYLKIMGEKNPIISDKILITSDPESASISIHEYIWDLGALGHMDKKSHRHRPIHWEDRLKRSEDAITVQFLFHTKDTKYSVRAFKAVLKAPFMVRSTLRDKLADGWMKIAGTTISTAGEIANIPGTKQFGTILDTINELNKDTAPVSHSYSWYSKTICAEEMGSLVDAVEWNITSRAFKNLGNHLIGGVVLMFFETEKEIEAKELKSSIFLEARARISFDDRDIWIPWDPDVDEEFKDKKNRLFLELFPMTEKKTGSKKVFIK